MLSPCCAVTMPLQAQLELRMRCADHMAEIHISMVRMYAGIHNSICRQGGIVIVSFRSSVVCGYFRCELKM